jgi:hypothetical protein
MGFDLLLMGFDLLLMGFDISGIVYVPEMFVGIFA